ncbi:MAG: zinc ribbon domain-containing protein [Deltaproteobacteria bacterium]|nr:zinc ribbon domain-containing protein [Deltaproteobacteria bacterium]
MTAGVAKGRAFRRAGWLAAVGVVLAVATAEGQSFEGTWTEVERSMTVTVESWGGDCPTAPQSSSSRPNSAVAVTQEGDQLVFPRGRRSDRCWSDNPAMRRTRFSKSGSRWTVECQTPDDDARREHGTYVLTATETRIQIDITSDYDWTLRESNCQARIVERRVLTRAAPAATDAGVQDAGTTEAAAPDARDGAFYRIDAGLRTLPDAQAAPRRCEHPGAPARLRVRAVQSVQPGGRAPLSVHQVDAQGCDLGAVQARFELLGDAKGCRIGSDGMFHACEAVAQCDGETVRIRATVGGLSATAEVRISARLEDGLGTVTPVWIDEPVDESGGPVGGAQVAASLQAQIPDAAGGPGAAGGVAVGEASARPVGGSASEEESDDSWVLWLVVGGGVAIVLAVAIYLVAAGRRRRRSPADAEIDDLAVVRASGGLVAPPAGEPAGRAPPGPTVPAPVLPEPQSAPVAAAPVVAAPAAPVWHCAACRRQYVAAGFCVDDGLSLLAGPAPTGAKTVIYAACPKCGRGYSSESKFCPVDRELLQPYGLGMSSYRAGLKGRPEPLERSCPKCGSSYPGSHRFCSRDGEQLVPAR